MLVHRLSNELQHALFLVEVASEEARPLAGAAAAVAHLAEGLGHLGRCVELVHRLQRLQSSP